MKKISMLCLAILLMGSTIAQTPNSFNYQAAVRDASGDLIKEKSVSIRITILSGSISGTSEFQEKHTVMTNKFGLLNLAIGAGTVVSGDLNAISWGDDLHFLKVELDQDGGSNYTVMGTQQLLSVPYALHASKADSIAGGVKAMMDKDKDTKIVLDETTDDDLIRFYQKGKEYFMMDNGRLEVMNTFGNTAMGENALLDNSSSSSNTVYGTHSMNKNTTGNYNTAIGGLTLYQNKIGDYNVALGYEALNNADSGSSNCAIGNQALFNNKGDENIAIGSASLFLNSSGSNNIGIGSHAIGSSKSGKDNIGIGAYTLQKNEGNSSIALGSNALQLNTGSYNIGIGKSALYATSTASYNTALGYKAALNYKGGNSTFIGANVGLNLTTGSFNVLIGSNAGGSTSSGSDNIAIGAYTNIPATASNSIAIGSGTSVTAGNQVRIGNASSTSIGGYAAWTNLSDGRFKTNVQENVVGLDFILKLRPVTYTLKMKEVAAFLGEDESKQGEQSSEMLEAQNEKSKIIQTGFIAQEVEAAANELGYKFSGVDVPKNENSHYGLRYAEFTVPLVKAVQEQQEIINVQQAEIDLLKARLEALEKLLLSNANLIKEN